MRFAVIGSGKTAVDIARTISTTPGGVLCGLLGNPDIEVAQSSLRRIASKLGVDYWPTRSLGDKSTLEFLHRSTPDVVVSANNFLIFRESTLAIPPLGTINFHNGPLPRYAGVNPCSWAILNREKRYGITWHLVEPELDAGEIVHQELFDIAPDETAMTLIIKCINAGITSFREHVLPQFLSGVVRHEPQDHAERSYFSNRDVPHGGDLPWWLERNDIEAYVRALTFAPMPNMFYEPRITLSNERVYHCQTVKLLAGESTEPGKVFAVRRNYVQVGCHGGLLELSDFSQVSGAAPENGSPAVTPGERLIRIID